MFKTFQQKHGMLYKSYKNMLYNIVITFSRKQNNILPTYFKYYALELKITFKKCF